MNAKGVFFPGLRKLSVVLLTIATLLGQATTSADTIFVGSEGAGVITQFAPTGVSSTFASGLSHPTGMVFDSVGNLYIANSDNTIRRFTPEGTSSIFASSGLNYPAGIGFDKVGNLYVCNTGLYDPTAQQYLSYVQKITPGGVSSFFADFIGGSPNDIACDQDGNIYVSDNFRALIMKFTPAGAGSIFASIGDFSSAPQGIEFDQAGNLYAARGPGGVIQKFSPNGLNLGAYASGLSNPTGLAFDSAGNLYVANFTNPGTIDRIAPNGTRSIFATGLSYPLGIAIIPEPSVATLLGTGGGALMAWRVRKRSGPR